MSEMNERDRFLAIMEGENMSASEFAKELGINAATVSNIVNGRNNPSLDVMKRACNRFRMISTDWLFLGIGSMYRQKVDAQEQVLLDVRPELPESDAVAGVVAEQPAAARKSSPQIVTVERVVAKRIKKIVVFYDDGTFDELNN